MGQRFRITAGEQVEHGGVARYGKHVHLRRVPMGLLAGLVQQGFQGLEDLMLQKGELSLQRRADAAHYVRGHGGLGD